MIKNIDTNSILNYFFKSLYLNEILILTLDYFIVDIKLYTYLLNFFYIIKNINN
jgi:hypothetical protein